jgi:NADPH:quinone reductase-like Zn-dependent oxidoreductase
MTGVRVRNREISAIVRGGPDVLELRHRDLPGTVPAGNARVRVAAAGVSFGDILLRVGVIPGGPKPPFTPGYEIAGVVEAVGGGVTAVRPGDRVAALLHEGGYTDLTDVPAERLVPLPQGVEPVDAAAVALNYFIAYQMLHRVAEVRGGQRVLVHGASGGVGLAFLQLGALAGIEIHGTASAAKHDIVREAGGNPIDYRAQDFVGVVRARTGGAGVDAVFDAIGGTQFGRSRKTLRKGGILVAYGQSAAFQDGKANKLLGARGFLGGIILAKLIPDGRRKVFYNAWSLEKAHPEAYREDLSQVFDLLAAGRIAPLVASTLPLEEAAKAHQLLESAAARGKIVLTP